jgi:hypothetical protein
LQIVKVQVYDFRATTRRPPRRANRTDLLADFVAEHERVGFIVSAHMNEDDKIAEAEYFIHWLKEAPSEYVRFEFSAFLNAARSVLQYAREEAKTKSGGQFWYDSEVKVDPLTGVLTNTRDINTHFRPIPVTVSATATVGGPAPPPPVRPVDAYSLTGWPGNENLVDLSERFLNEIRRIVSVGRARGFLSNL